MKDWLDIGLQILVATIAGALMAIGVASLGKGLMEFEREAAERTVIIREWIGEKK